MRVSMDKNEESEKTFTKWQSAIINQFMRVSMDKNEENAITSTYDEIKAALHNDHPQQMTHRPHQAKIQSIIKSFYCPICQKSVVKKRRYQT